MTSFSELPNKKPRACESNLNNDTNHNNNITVAPPAFDYAAMYAASGLSEEKDLNLPAAGAPGSKTKPCTKFFSTSGCPYGESCHFLHFVPGGIAALGMATFPNSMFNKQSAANGNANDPSFTVNGYKTRLCNRFNTPEGCRFGDNCHFAHGEADLRRPAKPNYALNQPTNTFNFGQQDPSGYVISTAVNYNADGSYAVATAAGAYAAFSNNPSYSTNTSTNYPYPTTTSYPPSTNYPSCTTNYPTSATNYPSCTTNYPSCMTGYSGYPSSYTSYNTIDPSSTAQTISTSSAAYYGEPTPPGVTVVPPMVMPTGYDQAALTA